MEREAEDAGKEIGQRAVHIGGRVRNGFPWSQANPLGRSKPQHFSISASPSPPLFQLLSKPNLWRARGIGYSLHFNLTSCNLQWTAWLLLPVREFKLQMGWGGSQSPSTQPQHSTQGSPSTEHHYCLATRLERTFRGSRKLHSAKCPWPRTSFGKRVGIFQKEETGLQEVGSHQHEGLGEFVGLGYCCFHSLSSVIVWLCHTDSLLILAFEFERLFARQRCLLLPSHLTYQQWLNDRGTSSTNTQHTNRSVFIHKIKSPTKPNYRLKKRENPWTYLLWVLPLFLRSMW